MAGDGWDLVRAWGYEVVPAETIAADAHISHPVRVVLVNVGLTPCRSEVVAWEVLSALIHPR